LVLLRERKHKASGTLSSYLKDIAESISWSEQDFTEIKLSRAILLLSIPAVLEMVMESVFVLVDIFFVSKLGADAVATVGITESLITIVYAISLGLAAATTSMVSRRIGEKNPDKAARTAVQAIITGICASVVIAIPGAIYSVKLLKIMGASAIITEQMSDYTTIMQSNVVIMFAYYQCNIQKCRRCCNCNAGIMVWQYHQYYT
jgi:Na+-driven multidrug efflux pump